MHSRSHSNSFNFIATLDRSFSSADSPREKFLLPAFLAATISPNYRALSIAASPIAAGANNQHVAERRLVRYPSQVELGKFPDVHAYLTPPPAIATCCLLEEGYRSTLHGQSTCSP